MRDRVSSSRAAAFATLRLFRGSNMKAAPMCYPEGLCVGIRRIMQCHVPFAALGRVRPIFLRNLPGLATPRWSTFT
jgi:hypothetical protein